MGKTITIGVTFSETKFPNYPAWIKDEEVEIIELSWVMQNLDDLSRCQGLLLTGGLDMDPIFYEPGLKCYANQPEKWNRVRDRFELDLFDLAQTLKMPVLGICRGLQLINIALGGTLVLDLQAAGKQNHRNIYGIDATHPLLLAEDSLLANICAIPEGIVNSAHHQAIDQVAETLRVNCYSCDAIIEGIEWKEKKNRSPLLGVQWHPERIENKEINPLSQNIRDWFIEEALKFKQ